MMKTKLFIIVFIILLFCISCSKQKPQENTEQEVTPVVIEEDTTSMEPEPIDVVEYEPAFPKAEQKPKPITVQSTSSISSSSYYSDNDDNIEDYYDNLRKHSPNDNYLLGFDEDVDDVHDMELYMEDY